MKKYKRDTMNTTSSSSSSSTATTKKKKIVRNGRKRKATTDGAGLLALVDAANKKIKKKNKAKRNALFIKWTEEEDKLLAELGKFAPGPFRCLHAGLKALPGVHPQIADIA